MYNFNLNKTFYGKKYTDNSVEDIYYIEFKDYSINLNIIYLTMLSNFLIIENKFPISYIFLDLYKFMGYNENVITYISYWNFFRKLKTIERYFADNNKQFQFHLNIQAE